MRRRSERRDPFVRPLRQPAVSFVERDDKTNAVRLGEEPTTAEQGSEEHLYLRRIGRKSERDPRGVAHPL